MGMSPLSRFCNGISSLGTQVSVRGPIPFQFSMKSLLPINWVPLVLGGLVLFPGCSSVEPTQSQATQGGEFAMTVKGTAKPTVVLQSGLGDGKETWAGILEGIARTHEVVAYDRPGYGETPGDNAPRDPCSAAREMRSMLKAANLRPPYILVGHSLGGLYQYAYAKLYPDEVAGLILLDPTHPNHWKRMQEEAPSAAAILKGVRFTVFSRAARREFDQQAEGLQTIDMSVPLRIPVRHLVRTQYQAIETGDFETMVHALEQDWSRLLGAREVIRADGSGHYIHKDRPDLVLGALRSLDAEISDLQRPIVPDKSPSGLR